jgi:PKD domain
MGWMSVKIELMVWGVVVLLISIILSGCAEQTAMKENTEQTLKENKPPIIQECRAEYFDRNNPATVFFVGSASDEDGTVILYSWNLSDGFTSKEQSFIHTFLQPGIYQAWLTVMDDKGMTNTSTITVSVNETSYEEG